MVSRSRAKKMTNRPKVIKPRPPSCISTISTHCPNKVKWVPVSTTVRPVTVAAETAVKNAWLQLVP